MPGIIVPSRHFRRPPAVVLVGEVRDFRALRAWKAIDVDLRPEFAGRPVRLRDEGEFQRVRFVGESEEVL